MSREKPDPESRRAPIRRFGDWLSGFPLTLILGGVFLFAFSDHLAGYLIAVSIVVVVSLAAAQWWVDRHRGDAPEVELVSISFYLVALGVAFAFASSSIDDLSAALFAAALVGLSLRSISKVLGSGQQNAGSE